MGKKSKVERKQDLLVKEYEIINNKTQFLENLVWKTFSLIGIISITLLFSENIVNKNLGVETTSILAIFSLALTLIWWKIAGRWWDVQSALYTRCRHIEEDLGIYSNRYINNKDGTSLLDRTDTLKSNRLEEISYQYNFGKKGIQKYFSYILVLVPICWIMMVLQKTNYIKCFSLLIEEYRIISTKSILISILLIEIAYAICQFCQKQKEAIKSIESAIIKQNNNDTITNEIIKNAQKNKNNKEKNDFIRSLKNQT